MQIKNKTTLSGIVLSPISLLYWGALIVRSLLYRLKIFKGPITLIRSGQNGILEKRKFRYSKGAAKGTYKNPYLYEGDIFYVGKNKFSLASEIINEITAPAQGIVNVYGIYKIFSD